MKHYKELKEELVAIMEEAKADYIKAISEIEARKTELAELNMP